MRLYYIIPLIALVLSACELEKDLDVDQLNYDDEYVVHGYIKPNQKAELLLRKSNNFLSTQSTPIINDALVTIQYGSTIDTLTNGDYFNENGAFYNFTTKVIIPEDYNQTFNLKIVTADNTITGSTQLLKLVPIDSIEVEQNESNEYLHLTYLTDDGAEKNFYRRVISIYEDGNKVIEQDFNTNDDVLNGESFPFGTGYDFESEDSIISTIYHITEDHFKYLESVENSIDANGNPFGQSGQIVSNINGGLGIFSGINASTESIKLP